MGKLIYIADDEKNIRDLMTLFLQNDGFQVKAFDNGDSLFDAFMERASDMVILDIMMPGTDGLTICSKIRSIHNVPIIIASALDGEVDRVKGITMGSDDYLSKPFSPMELVARVKAIFRRIELEHMTRSHINDNSYGDIKLDNTMMHAFVNNSMLDLTPTEFSVLSYLIDNSEQSISREELIENVWKYDNITDTRVTDDVIKRLRKKLNNANSTTKISTVWGYGFRLEKVTEE